MTTLIGLVAGTVFYQKDYFMTGERKVMETPFGPADILLTDSWAYVPRHSLQGEKYVPPHLINHRANLSALKELGVMEVIGVNSCGSLRPSLSPGSIVLPNDYISLVDVPTVFESERGHITPVLSHRIQAKLVEAAKMAEVRLVEGGIYWQNKGPRLETKAEIRFQSQYADMVGMTMASEATIAQELALEYAAICSVDNYGHGLSPKCLSSDEIQANASANAEKMLKILQTYLEIK